MIRLPLAGIGFGPHGPELRWDRRQLVLVSAFALLAAAALLPSVWVVRELFDAWIPRGDRRATLIGCIALFVIRAGTAALTLLQRQAGVRLAKDFAVTLRIGVARRLLEADPRAFDALDPARIQTRMVKETERIDVMLNRLTTVVLPASLTAVIAATGMVLVSPLLTAVVLAVVVFVLLAQRRHSDRVRKRSASFQGAFEAYAASTTFLVRHAELIRSRGFEDGELRHQESVIESLRDSGSDMANAHAQNGQIQAVFVGWIAIATLIVGGQQVISGDSSVGNLAAFYFVAALLAQAILQIVSAQTDLISGRQGADRLAELWLALPPVSESLSGTACAPKIATIELRDINVDYQNREILRGLSLDLRPGEHVDVSGPNGAGKTTLLRVISGLLPPRSGQVLVGGYDLSELSSDNFRRRIGVAPQRPTFFGGSIAENIAYGRPGAGIEDIHWALRIVGLTRLVDSLPAGIDSAMGDEGVRLSGGEAQRASIARALVGRPELLVLDEPGNHLPAAELADVLGRIRSALPRTTIITAGHNADCARMADRALVLHDGALEEPAVHA